MSYVTLLSSTDVGERRSVRRVEALASIVANKYTFASIVLPLDASSNLWAASILTNQSFGCWKDNSFVLHDAMLRNCKNVPSCCKALYCCQCYIAVPSQLKSFQQATYNAIWRLPIGCSIANRKLCNVLIQIAITSYAHHSYCYGNANKTKEYQITIAGTASPPLQVVIVSDDFLLGHSLWSSWWGAGTWSFIAVDCWKNHIRMFWVGDRSWNWIWEINIGITFGRTVDVSGCWSLD